MRAMGARLLLLSLAVAVGERLTWRVGYHGLEVKPHYHWDAARARFVGAYPDVMTLLAAELGVDIVDVYIPVNPDYHFLDLTEWIHGVFEDGVDVMFSQSPFYAGVFYSAPVMGAPLQGLLRVETSGVGLWSLFDPFHWRVWIAICASVVLGTVVAGAIAYINREWDPRKDPLEFGAMLYHSVTLILGGEDLSGVLLPRHDPHHPSRQSRRAGHGGVDRVRAAPPAGSALPRARHDGELHGEPRGVPHESAARRPRPEEPRRHEMRDAASYDAPS